MNPHKTIFFSTITLLLLPLAVRAATVREAMLQFPPECDAVVALDTTAFENPESILSIVLIDRARRLAEESEVRRGLKQTRPAAGTLEALIRLELDPNASRHFTIVSFGVFNDPTSEEQQSYGLLTTDFERRYLPAVLAPYGIGWWRETDNYLFPSPRPYGIHMDIPTPGWLRISNQPDWVDQAATEDLLLERAPGVQPPLQKMVGEFVSPESDLALYISGRMVRAALESTNSGKGTAIAVLAGARSFLLVTSPGIPPVARLYIRYPGAEQAAQARAGLAIPSRQLKDTLISGTSEKDGEEGKLLRFAAESLETIRIQQAGDTIIMELDFVLPEEFEQLRFEILGILKQMIESPGLLKSWLGP